LINRARPAVGCSGAAARREAAIEEVGPIINRDAPAATTASIRQVAGTTVCGNEAVTQKCPDRQPKAPTGAAAGRLRQRRSTIGCDAAIQGQRATHCQLESTTAGTAWIANDVAEAATASQIDGLCERAVRIA